MYRKSVLWIAGLLATFIAGGSSAATLNVVGGQLLGASDVNVGGNFFDVEFLDGTCIALFNGCDDAADFTFNNSTDALLASTALLDQVFLDGGSGLFDTDPELTEGCTDLDHCDVFIPYAPIPTSSVSVAFPGNWAPGGAAPDGNHLGGVSVNLNTSSLGATVYAVWTPVPEPGTALLMGLGLLAMGVHSRREG